MQLVEGVRHALGVGTLRAGERLPMVRALARELTVTPNTVVKAYGELQQMGLIESRPGVGTVVVANTGEAVRKRQVEDLYERLDALVCDAVGPLGDGERPLGALRSGVRAFPRAGDGWWGGVTKDPGGSGFARLQKNSSRGGYRCRGCHTLE